MRLKDLEKYGRVTIQCHDNPDADALASGYGLYSYFHSKGIPARLLYSGNQEITKANLRLMVDKLGIPVEYVNPFHGQLSVDGLLITVDCQYGAGNVWPLRADEIAIIDHHREEIVGIALCRIQSSLGSCSTLVWSMLQEEGFSLEDNRLGTALYYGLYTDTNQFSELFNPLDMDMREALVYNRSLITQFCNSNMSLKELEIAGIALIRHSYNDDYRFAVIKAQPCDPNILGLISDFLLQVDEIDTCVVYNEVNERYKYSVRSCIKEVCANELAAYLSEGIGSGGGHREKAGGVISVKLYEEKYPTLHSEAYFNSRMTMYFDDHEIIYASEYEVDTSDMAVYEKKKLPEAYVKAAQVFPLGTPITIRTQEGDLNVSVEKDLYIILGMKGEVYPCREEMFQKSYRPLEKRYEAENTYMKAEYIPIMKDPRDGKSFSLLDYAMACMPAREIQVYAKALKKAVKVFSNRDEEHYVLGRIGDYLTVDREDRYNIFVIEKEIFHESYGEIY